MKCSLSADAKIYSLRLMFLHLLVKRNLKRYLDNGLTTIAFALHVFMAIVSLCLVGPVHFFCIFTCATNLVFPVVALNFYESRSILAWRKLPEHTFTVTCSSIKVASVNRTCSVPENPKIISLYALNINQGSFSLLVCLSMSFQFEILSWVLQSYNDPFSIWVDY